MSNDRAAVFRTTKVRTKLRGDGSWLQQQDEPDAETQEEEKPWLADVRARRLNGAPIDTSPVSSPVKTTPPPVKSDTESKPSTQGYLIRGVFTKLDNPVSSPSYNGPSKPKLFTKRPSESYKKIAPHTVRSSSENPEDQLSPEEQEKRKEAAISVLKKKPSKRSYVLSAAKLYEDKDTSPETSPASSSPSFVAKRVEIVDDSKSAPTPSPASTEAPYPAVPPTSAASTPAPKPQTAVNTTVKTTDESAVKEPVNPKATNPPPKLNEVKDILPDTTLANSSPLFVAKRVEVVDDSKKAAPPAPSSTVASSPAVPPTSAASTPAPKPQTAVNTTVKTTDESTVKEPVNVKSTSPAAKLNEAKDTSPDSTLASSSPSFVAKRVEIVDDSKSAPTPSPASTVAPYPAVPPTSAASTPAPKPQTAVNTTVKTTDESAVKEPVNPKATNPPPKLNEVKDILPDTTLANSSPLFVAKRVEVVDDSKKAAPPAPSSTVASSPAVPPTSAASTPAPKPQTAVNTTVKTTDESAVKELANPKATNLPAKLNEAKDTSPDTTLASSSPSFLTKKVEIINDSKSAPTPAPASTVAPYPAVPPISAASTPAPKPQTAVNTTVKTTDESAVKELANPKATNLPAVPEKEEPLLQSNAEKQQTEDKKTKSSNTTITGSVRVATTAPQTKAETPLVKLLPSSKTSPAQKSVGSDSPALTSTVTVPPVPVPRSAPTTASPAPVTPVPVLTVAELMVKTEPEPEQEPELKDEAEAEPEDEPEVEHELEPSAEPSADDKLELAEEEEGSVDSQTPENMAVDEPIPVETELLVDYSGPKEPAKTYQRISHEMVNLICSEPSPAKASDTLDLLANDVDIVHTEGHSLSIQQQKEEKEKQTDETAVETQSLADPFDPYPIGTASHNSLSDLLEPVADVSINSSTTPEGKKSSSPEVTSAAADLSQLSWTTKWEIPKQTNTEESQEAATEDQSGDQQTVIKFEKKSTEIDSPWNRWTSPTVYTISNTTGDEDKEEEEVKEEESPEDSQKVTTITTVREIQNEPEPTMAQSASPSTALIEEERRVPTPESETKKPFVYVKEYVNASDMALLNSSSDDFASSSINYLYSSPSSYTRVSLSSSCMYCGKQVDNNAKITIEHLNINCHPECFKCDVCSKPMGDLLHGMFLHQKKVYCESCYATVI